MAYPAIGAFAHVSTLNDTTFQMAQKSEVVGSVVRNAVTFAGGSPSKRSFAKKERYASMEPGISSDFVGHNSSDINKRALPNQLSPALDDLIQSSPPLGTRPPTTDPDHTTHLKFLKATWFDDSGNGYNGQDYAYESSLGAGVTIYVVDTGVDENHPVSSQHIDRTPLCVRET